MICEAHDILPRRYHKHHCQLECVLVSLLIRTFDRLGGVRIRRGVKQNKYKMNRTKIKKMDFDINCAVVQFEINILLKNK